MKTVPAPASAACARASAPPRAVAIQAIELPPYWKVCPANEARPAPGLAFGPGRCPPQVIRLYAGPGWGAGDHPSSQLCLQAIGFLVRSGFAARRVLDFGAGSGILSIACALHGAEVEAVEIEEPALAHTRQNLETNGVTRQVTLRTTMSEPTKKFDLVLANILCPVLLDTARDLCERLEPGGHLVLSGLVATDVPRILARYQPLLPHLRAGVYQRGEWRAVMFGPAASSSSVVDGGGRTGRT